MSDFLGFNVTDEIINGTPKYNITDNTDGTKSIELANEVIQNGTALNKSTFDKLKVANNVMGYNELNYELIREEPIDTTIEFKNTTSEDYELTNGIILNVENLSQRAITKPNVNSLRTSSNTSASGYFIIKFNEGYNITSLSSYATGAVGFLRAYNGDTELREITLSSSSTDYILPDNTNKIQLNLRTTTSGTGYLYVQNIHYDIVDTTCNFLHDYEFENNQVIDIKNVVTATSFSLNNKPIDTLLQSGKYYELLYDEPNDRFIAHEERV